MHKRILTAMAVAGVALCGAGAVGGAEVLPVEQGDGDSMREIEFTTCGAGVLKECGSTTTQRCDQYSTSSAGGGLTIQPNGGGISGNMAKTCISMTTTTVKLYKDRYKPKTAA